MLVGLPPAAPGDGFTLVKETGFVLRSLNTQNSLWICPGTWGSVIVCSPLGFGFSLVLSAFDLDNSFPHPPPIMIYSTMGSHVHDFEIGSYLFEKISDYLIFTRVKQCAIPPPVPQPMPKPSHFT